ncbi:MAG TPA: tyrosine-type recombinase/integrase [Opitutaceae bacterium]|nr:tyrosine-type recombinase/integrase [Opitutaceae bacterium]
MRLVSTSGKRSFPYLTAACTGLRRGELRQLLWSDIRLDVAKPYIEVRAETTKSKRGAVVPLLPMSLDVLKREYAKGTHLSGRVFPRGLPSVKSFTKDLNACGISSNDQRGYRLDFHALRHTFASLLATAQLSELARVKLARHSE